MPRLLSPGNGQEAEDRVSLLSIIPVNPSPDTLTSNCQCFKRYDGLNRLGLHRTYQSTSRVDADFPARRGRL
jgi:hypothetical protein